MVTATADPLVQPLEKWTVQTRDSYLVVFKYALGTRLYLLEQPNQEEVELLLQIHNNVVSSAPLRICGLIRAFAESHKEQLIYDTADRRNPPAVASETRLILTGL